MKTLLTFLLLSGCIVFEASRAEAQMITAHRGASYDAPENTLAAFRLAFEQAADAIEGDFYLTSDQRIACIHDKDTKRTAGVKLVVEESSWDQLRALEVGAWKSQAFQGERVPSFEEVWRSIPAGKKFVIELKSGPKIVPVLVQELERLRIDPAVVLIIAFNQDTVSLCKQRLPGYRVHWLTDSKVKGSDQKMTADQVAQVVKKCHADGVGMQGDMAVIDAQFVSGLKAAGCPEFHVWTVDDPEAAKQFQALGAMGITTNRPAFIRQSLWPESPSP